MNDSPQPDEADAKISYSAMLPELRAGLRHAAERRARQAFPGVRFWELTLAGGLFGGIGVWLAAELPLLRAFGCAGGLLSLGALLVLGWWWSRLIRRCMREVLLDPRRCLRCGYPLAGLEGPNCPECGEPFVREQATI